jgi:hypothetical protein
MLHPAFTRALATAHIEDQLRAAARWHAIRRALRVARESRVAVTSTAGQRSTSTPHPPRQAWALIARRGRAEMRVLPSKARPTSTSAEAACSSGTGWVTGEGEVGMDP